MVPFDSTLPVFESALTSSEIRNQLIALFNSDLSPLRPRASDPMGMTVYVNPSLIENFWNQVWWGSTTLSFEGDDSPIVVAPEVNPRIDLLSINSDGELEWTEGEEAEAPTAPVCPAGKLPICLIYCKTTMVKICNFEDTETYPNDGYVYQDIRPFIGSQGSSSPTGMITAFGGTVAPTGWLICDGAAINRTIYATLFSIIGTAYGVGDGSTTFNLPNLQQRFPLGKAVAGTGSTLGETGGAIDHVHTGPSHDHTLKSTGTSVSNAQIDCEVVIHDGILRFISVGGASYYRMSLTTTAGGTGNTGTGNPPFQTVNYIIKF